MDESYREFLDSLTPEERREHEESRQAELRNYPLCFPSPTPTDGCILWDSPPFGPSAESRPASPLVHSPSPIPASSPVSFDSPIMLPTSVHPPLALPPPPIPHA